jgi:hypothetical protein
MLEGAVRTLLAVVGTGGQEMSKNVRTMIKKRSKQLTSQLTLVTTMDDDDDEYNKPVWPSGLWATSQGESRQRHTTAHNPS